MERPRPLTVPAPRGAPNAQRKERFGPTSDAAIPRTGPGGRQATGFQERPRARKLTGPTPMRHEILPGIPRASP